MWRPQLTSSHPRNPGASDMPGRGNWLMSCMSFPQACTLQSRAMPLGIGTRGRSGSALITGERKAMVFEGKQSQTKSCGSEDHVPLCVVERRRDWEKFNITKPSSSAAAPPRFQQARKSSGGGWLPGALWMPWASAALGRTCRTPAAGAPASFLTATGHVLSLRTFILFLLQPSLGQESTHCGSNALGTFENPGGHVREGMPSFPRSLSFWLWSAACWRVVESL